MKKLVLYSDQIIPATDKVDQQLLTLIGKSNPTMGYVPSSSDPDRRYFQERQAYYARYSITLSVYFELDVDYQPDLLEALLTCDVIHLTGGNTYYFLHWLRKRNMLLPLRQYVAQGGVLVGVSAGAILMTPDIVTAALCGDEPVEPEMDLSALHLVDFAFVPHLNPGAASLAALQTYSRQHQVTVYGCRDGDGIVVENDQVKCIGDIVVVVNGKVVPADQ